MISLYESSQNSFLKVVLDLEKFNTMLEELRRFIYRIFMFKFGGDYGKVRQFCDHIYIPESDLTVFSRPNGAVTITDDGNMRFSQRWYIMSAKMLMEACPVFNSRRCDIKLDTFNLYAVSHCHENGALRMVNEMVSKLNDSTNMVLSKRLFDVQGKCQVTE